MARLLGILQLAGILFAQGFMAIPINGGNTSLIAERATPATWNCAVSPPTSWTSSDITRAITAAKKLQAKPVAMYPHDFRNDDPPPHGPVPLHPNGCTGTLQEIPLIGGGKAWGDAAVPGGTSYRNKKNAGMTRVIFQKSNFKFCGVMAHPATGHVGPVNPFVACSCSKQKTGGAVGGEACTIT